MINVFVENRRNAKESKDSNLLNELANNKDVRVREVVAGNIYTSIDTLARLAEYDNFHIMKAVCNNKNTTNLVMLNVYRKIKMVKPEYSFGYPGDLYLNIIPIIKSILNSTKSSLALKNSIIMNFTIVRLITE